MKPFLFLSILLATSISSASSYPYLDFYQKLHNTFIYSGNKQLESCFNKMIDNSFHKMVTGIGYRLADFKIHKVNSETHLELYYKAPDNSDNKQYSLCE